MSKSKARQIGIWVDPMYPKNCARSNHGFIKAHLALLFRRVENGRSWRSNGDEVAIGGERGSKLIMLVLPLVGCLNNLVQETGLLRLGHAGDSEAEEERERFHSRHIHGLPGLVSFAGILFLAGQVGHHKHTAETNAAFAQVGPLEPAEIFPELCFVAAVHPGSSPQGHFGGDDAGG